ncbi:MAG: prepilin-type N-terminal cleavage/methylation domain-containing protein [Sedimentisphaerales bacterium]|nr:prepilin-type N-terminal cleavage/methylation domain-containing protein [Sedimentisphaerales bacterium]
MALRRTFPGFTLVELMVVIAITGLLMGFLLPALTAARQKAQTFLNQNNMKQMSLAVTFYSEDNRGYMPPSQALIDRAYKNWHDARLIFSYYEGAGNIRSIFERLKSYSENIENWFCPHAPTFPSFANDIWDSTHDPNTPDIAYGHYAFLWGGYTACNLNTGGLFKGPTRIDARRFAESNILVCDYAGLGNWQWVPGYEYTEQGVIFASCNNFTNANNKREQSPPPYPSLWTVRCDALYNYSDCPNIDLNAVLKDGSVQKYHLADTLPAMRFNGRSADPWFGIYFLPNN